MSSVHETHAKMRQDKKSHQVWIKPVDKDCRLLVNGEAITEEVSADDTKIFKLMFSLN